MTSYNRKPPRVSRRPSPVDEPMDIDKLKVTREMHEIFALAFEGSGGLARLIKLLKGNNTKFLNFIPLVSKLITLKTVSEVNATVTVEDSQSIDALAALLENTRRARQAEEADRASRAGITIQDGESYQDALERTLLIGPPRPIHDCVTIDAVANAELPATEDTAPQSTAPRPEPPAAQPASPVASPKVVNLHTGPSIPGLYAGAVMEGLDDNRSTTQKFLDWRGHGRPPGS